MALWPLEGGFEGRQAFMHAEGCFALVVMRLTEPLPHSQHMLHNKVRRQCLWGSQLMIPIYGTCVEQLRGAAETVHQ